MARVERPRFTPLPSLPNDPWDPLRYAADDIESIPVCSCPVGFPVEPFEAAMSELINHPEYNSTLILRSEIIEETEKASSGLEVPTLQDFRFVKNIRRRLLPRRPGRDPPIEQVCTFYADTNKVLVHDVDDATHEDEPAGDNEMPVSCVVLTPKLVDGVSMPYYHPAVFHIAFRYLQPPVPTDDDGSDGQGNGEARLCIEVVLQPGAPDPKDVNSRLYRTCISLLETVYRYGWGIITDYRKQAHHDCIISREEYQDLYLVMRERYKHLVGQWHENTDPLKHVYEDIGIATYLMLLWKQDTSGSSISPVAKSINNALAEASLADRKPWYDWPRPRGGFLDFGCGNGLLVHILVSEGYDGDGIDLRARNSWRHYPPETQAHLHVHALNPLDLCISPHGKAPVISNPFLKPGSFIVANHADELSPWAPVLATLSGAAGFLSIPCCSWSFDARFERKQMPLDNNRKSTRDPAFAFGPPDDTGIDAFVESLHLGGMGGDARKSVYAAYRVWLACLGIHCGWAAESDTLRIPSTRNWALIGRKRCGEESSSIQNALTIVDKVRERGMFKTRRPEDKAGNHSH